ncbi:MAG: tetratricopeptide repeat protein, partial [Haloplasmataceae bacterium]|nr:tetratricopeptide repeat protein [Haloplasmataceae bacterium]
VKEEQINAWDTIGICLREEERCYPYFIGILGGRYGWIPSDLGINFNSDFYLANKEKIIKYIEEEKSINEMEIRLGVFDRDEAIESHFYMGDGLIYYDKINLYNNSQLSLVEKIRLINKNDSKQDAFKKEIKLKNKYEIKYFTNKNSLADLINEDLNKMIDEKFAVEDMSEEELISVDTSEKQKTCIVECEELNQNVQVIIEQSDKSVPEEIVYGQSPFISKWVTSIMSTIGLGLLIYLIFWIIF